MIIAELRNIHSNMTVDVIDLPSNQSPSRILGLAAFAPAQRERAAFGLRR
jgi:hypothetical protein